jgi:hypothetical protein
MPPPRPSPIGMGEGEETVRAFFYKYAGPTGLQNWPAKGAWNEIRCYPEITFGNRLNRRPNRFHFRHARDFPAHPFALQ